MTSNYGMPQRIEISRCTEPILPLRNVRNQSRTLLPIYLVQMCLADSGTWASSTEVLPDGVGASLCGRLQGTRNAIPRA
jgi:hypothetical protein